MKQVIRLFFKPSTFFNQLQWSSHHWFILVTFLSLVTLETQVGKAQHLYQMAALLLEQRFQIGLAASLWIVTFFKLAFSLLAAFALIMLIDFIGSNLGRKNSKRVLSRRFALVFTVFQVGLILRHFHAVSPWVEMAAYAVFFWSFLLGFYALKEHFELKNVETMVVGLFLLLLVKTTWNFSKVAFEGYLKQEVQALAHKTLANPSTSRLR